MVGIIGASVEEMRPVMKEMGLENPEFGKWAGRVKDIVYVAIASGRGMQNAQNTTWDLITLGCDKIINIGTVGDCGTHETAEIVVPSMFYNGDFDVSEHSITKDPAAVNNRYIVDGNVLKPRIKETCYSLSSFQDSPRLSNAVVDMESYGIASACTHVGIPFLSIKVVATTAGDRDVMSEKAKNITDIIYGFDNIYELTYKTEEE